MFQHVELGLEGPPELARDVHRVFIPHWPGSLPGLLLWELPFDLSLSCKGNEGPYHRLFALAHLSLLTNHLMYLHSS